MPSAFVAIRASNRVAAPATCTDIAIPGRTRATQAAPLTKSFFRSSRNNDSKASPAPELSVSRAELSAASPRYTPSANSFAQDNSAHWASQTEQADLAPVLPCIHSFAGVSSRTPLGARCELMCSTHVLRMALARHRAHGRPSCLGRMGGGGRCRQRALLPAGAIMAVGTCSAPLCAR